MKAFVIITSIRFANREDIQNFLTSRPEVPYWYACFQNCIFCTSSLSTHALAKLLEGHFGHARGRRFVVLEVGDRQGRLPAEAWHLFNSPESPRLP